MNFKKPKCKFYFWDCELPGAQSDMGVCINPETKQSTCTLPSSETKTCYLEGVGTWGPGNDKMIKKIEEIEQLDAMMDL